MRRQQKKKKLLSLLWVFFQTVSSMPFSHLLWCSDPPSKFFGCHLAYSSCCFPMYDPYSTLFHRTHPSLTIFFCRFGVFIDWLVCFLFVCWVFVLICFFVVVVGAGGTGIFLTHFFSTAICVWQFLTPLAHAVDDLWHFHKHIRRMSPIRLPMLPQDLS